MTTQHRTVLDRESGVSGSLSRVVQLSELVVLNHVELLKLDTRDRLREFTHRLALMSATGGLLGIGWIALVGAILVSLSDRFSWPVLLLGASALHVLVALGLMLIASTRRAARDTQADG